MMNIHSLIKDIFLGEFGLLTMTPSYLFKVLFPIMIVINLLSSFLPKLPFIKTHSKVFYNISFILTGLGCTTAGLLALSPMQEKNLRYYFTLLLVLVVPCSAQLSLIMVFASMVTLRLFLVFIIIYSFTISLAILLLKRFYPSNDTQLCFHSVTPTKGIKNAFTFVCNAALPFAFGSLLITLATDLGLFDYLSEMSEVIFNRFLGLPKEASNIFLLNILKRDFGSASLLSMTKYFTADQLIETMLILLFFVPCFNSFIILIKQERLPKACFLWLGSLSFSIFIGKLFRCIFSICFI